MTTSINDMIGKVFGRLTIIKFYGKDSHRCRVWICRCVCGNETKVTTQHLRSGHTKSCGCYNAEQAAIRSTKHGLRSTHRSEYETWKSMRSRCNNLNDKDYKYYGGKGVKVCDRWLSFANFMSDMGARPSPKHQIDRFPNNDGNYELSNCRWATLEQQSRNRSDNRILEHDGRRMILSDWSRLFNINPSTLISHLKTNDFATIVNHYANNPKFSRIRPESLVTKIKSA